MSATTRLALVTVPVLALLLAACGEPTAQRVQPGQSPFSYEVPAEFTDIGLELEEQPGLAYGLPESSIDTLSNDPVLFVGTSSSGDLESFQSLRILATRGEFDPLDTSLEELPNNTRVLAYAEIGEADVWGIRMRLAIGRGATDFQALVDRESDQVVMTEVICTQACFLEQLDLIDRIQTSWSLER